MLVILIGATLALVAIPVWLIQPFKVQTNSALEWSYILRQASPVVTLAGFLLAALVCFSLWRQSRWWQRVLLFLFLLFPAVLLWFSRQNHFEWMFNPNRDPSYVRIGDVHFIKDTDMVLGVRIHGEASAYPVRLLAYHHLVQDRVGGVPIVATY